MSDTSATWSISLDTSCPACGEGFDMLDIESFRESGIDPLEAKKGEEITCPKCGHDFTVDLEY